MNATIHHSQLGHFEAAVYLDKIRAGKTLEELAQEDYENLKRLKNYFHPDYTEEENLESVQASLEHFLDHHEIEY